MHILLYVLLLMKVDQMQVHSTSSVDSLLDLLGTKYFKYLDVWYVFFFNQIS